MGGPKKAERPAAAERNARERLLEAALDEFGRFGFEAATTRRIARRAGVNIALIPYYFQGKEGLYKAVVEHAIGRIESQVAPALQEINRRSAQEVAAPEAVALLTTLLAGMVDFMVGSAEAPRFAPIMLREQMYPSAAYEIIFRRIMTPVIHAIARMVSIAIGQPLTETVKLRAFALVGQVLVFRVARETVVRSLGMVGYSASETEQIRRVVLDQTEAAIQGLIQKSRENRNPGT